MITAPQLRAARALLGIDQRQLAAMAGLSVPTIQRMEASDGVIRGNVDSLMKLIAALELAGIDLIAEGAVSPSGGRGVRLKAALNDVRSEPLSDAIEGPRVLKRGGDDVGNCPAAGRRWRVAGSRRAGSGLQTDPR
jgi:transcriptional regulator with XRE-family HTH domain